MNLLLSQPQRFRFDAVLRILTRAKGTPDVAEAVEFRTQPGRFYPAGEVTSVVRTTSTEKPLVTVAVIGLIGAGGVLPRLYEATAANALRRGSRALHDFVDMLSQRMVAFFAQAGIKYRLHRAAESADLAGTQDPVSGAVLALTGHGTGGLVERIEGGADLLLYYAGLFATRPRSAERLSALVSDWLGRPVTVCQFAGTWLNLPPDQRTSLPKGQSSGSWNTLGGGAALGVRSWDLHARIILRIGPLDQTAFEALLPDQPGYRRLTSLVRAFLGAETGFAINPVLAASSRFPLRLDAGRPPRLGWNSWISPTGAGQLPHAQDARFEVT